MPESMKLLDQKALHTNFSLSLCPAYDKFVSNLKSSVRIEKQKNSLLGEEIKIKKGTVERLRSELKNTKEQLEYMKEEKGKKILCCKLWSHTCTVEK